MKNIIKLLLVVMALVLVITAFTACEPEQPEVPEVPEDPTPEVCKHENVEFVMGKEPTCTEDGLTSGFKCKDCGEWTVAQEVDPAGHDYVIDVEVGPTCTAAGYTEKKCARCDATTDHKVIVPYGHKLVDVKGKDATCTEDGYSDYKACKYCDHIEGVTVIPAGHAWGEADANGNVACSECGVVKVSTAAGLQAALDAAKKGTTIELTANVNYGSVVIGRPTKYNDTTMLCETHEFTTTDVAEFVAHLSDGAYHTTPRYTTTLEEITIVGAEGATIGGLLATSGHVYGDAYDYVRDIDYDQGSVYYVTLNLAKITFLNVQFTGKVDINTSDADSIYDGVSFIGCSFTTGGVDAANGAGIRYYNESNNGHVRNLIVKDCTFVNCYQGMYVANVNGVTVVDSEFDTTGHNAIAIQSTTHGEVALKSVVITGNEFKNIADRIIRFGEIAADSSITIQNNTATNSGDEDGEVMKAVSIAEGITTSIKNNSWGGTVVDDQLKDEVD